MKTPDPAVGIVVVNWNGADQSRRCLRSLRGLTYLRHKVCLVDNGSTDGSADLVKGEFPEVNLLTLPSNRGYAGGCNAGIVWAREAGMRYVWLLNNDATVDAKALQALVTSAEDLRAMGSKAILAPKILLAEAPGKVWFAGGSLRWPWLEREHIGIGEEEDRHDTPRQIEWASGCALFFPLAIADIIGPMDERYFLYLEDVDWCLRARRHGIPIWFVPGARLWHDVSRSVGDLDSRHLRYYFSRNYFILAFDHCGVVGRMWASLRLSVTLLKVGVRVLFFPSYRRDAYYPSQTRALLDFLRRRFGKAPFPDESDTAPVSSRTGEWVS